MTWLRIFAAVGVAFGVYWALTGVQAACRIAAGRVRRRRALRAFRLAEVVDIRSRSGRGAA